MTNAILVHGFCDKAKYYDPDHPSMSNNQWFPWLTQQLMVRDIFTVAPELPEPWQPNYEKWRRELERFDINEQTILVGHSFGGGFLVRYLSENNIKVGKVILVAPYMGLGHGEDLEQKSSESVFFDFNIDQNLARKTAGLTIFKSTNDAIGVDNSIDILMEKWGDSVKLITLPKRGHFMATIKWTKFEFTELLEEIITESNSARKDVL
jgi:predicted alpha/beta hydrolase family esterase